MIPPPVQHTKEPRRHRHHTRSANATRQGQEGRLQGHRPRLHRLLPIEAIRREEQDRPLAGRGHLPRKCWRHRCRVQSPRRHAGRGLPTHLGSQRREPILLVRAQSSARHCEPDHHRQHRHRHRTRRRKHVERDGRQDRFLPRNRRQPGSRRLQAAHDPDLRERRQRLQHLATTAGRIRRRELPACRGRPKGRLVRRRNRPHHHQGQGPQDRRGEDRHPDQGRGPSLWNHPRESAQDQTRHAAVR